MKKFCLSLSVLLFFYKNQVWASEQGMPQLNPEFWSAQIFWLILVFSSLYMIIWKIFLPKISNSIENRKSRVINDVNEAQKIKENAEKKLKEYEKIIEDSKKQAKKITDDAKKKLDLDIEKKKQKFNEDMEKELIDVEKEIINLKKSSLLNINKIAEEISSNLIKQIMGVEINASKVSATVKDISNKRSEKYL